MMCPILAVRYGNGANCIETDCAWWTGNRCAVRSIACNLGVMSFNLADMAHPKEESP